MNDAGMKNQQLKRKFRNVLRGSVQRTMIGDKCEGVWSCGLCRLMLVDNV